MDNLTSPNEPDELHVLWTSSDREVALSMVFMYVFNSKTRGFWENVNLIVWGPSAKLLGQDEELQGRVKQMIEAGVKVSACVACANMYGVAGILEKLGIEVKGMGQPLTQLMKEGKKILCI